MGFSVSGLGGGVLTSVPGFGERREAREDALAVLYESELTGTTVSEALARRAIELSEYAQDMALGVETRRDTIDASLRRHLVRWRLERMAVVDRALARLATWELAHSPQVPTGVVLSEAVVLATQYCGAESPRFLNGVLSAVAEELRDDPNPSRITN